jgi:hypothetical protein
MWVRFWPAPGIQSTLLLTGSYLPIALAPSAVKHAFPAYECRSMRPAPGSEINGWQCLLPDQIHHRQCVGGTESVVRDLRRLAVGGRHHLVRILAHRYPRNHLQAGRIDDRQRFIVLGQPQQCIRRCACSVYETGSECNDEQNEEGPEKFRRDAKMRQCGRTAQEFASYGSLFGGGNCL